MTYEEARKFLKNVITYPLKPDGENKYPNYWRAKFIDVLNLLDGQAEVLRIFKKYPKWRGSLKRLSYISRYFKEQKKEITDELLAIHDIPFEVEEFRMIIEWLEEKE